MAASKAAKNESLPLVRLPEPWKTTYELKVVSCEKSHRILKLCHAPRQDDGIPPPEPLHHDSLLFTEFVHPSKDRIPSEGNNSAWARAQRAPVSHWAWGGNTPPTVGQIWNVVHALVSLPPHPEIFRVTLSGPGQELLAEELQGVGLAVKHPEPSAPPGQPVPESKDHANQLVVSQGAFWQGAGAPFGTRPPWVADPQLHDQYRRPLSDFPLQPQQYTLTTKFADVRVHSYHPVRLAKPKPGSRIYSRYIPHLDEFFSMVALDYQNEEHLQLFHKWQNDPRVSKGWNETGTLEQHREYLRRAHEDPHQLTVLAKFNDVYFAYYEFYWAKEDHLGAYFNAGDWDRGRHSLVGDVRFRGPHRALAWWCSQMHYLFLDDPRTMCLVGEPKATNTTVLAYDFAHGFTVEKLVDLPHKRSALVKCTREKFFQISPFWYTGEDPVPRNPDRALKL